MSIRRDSHGIGTRMVACGAALLMLAALGAQAAGDGVSADGWRFPGDRRTGPVAVEISQDGTAVTVTFSRSAFPSIQSVDIVAGSEGNGTFTGDYVDAGIQGATFTVDVEGDAPRTKLMYFRSEAGDEFRYPAALPEADETVSNVVSLTSGDGWKTDPYGTAVTDADLAEATVAVSEIGVRVAAKSRTPGGSITIGNFMLYGEGFTTDPADLRPVIWRLGREHMNRLRLRWSARKGRRYTILRCDSLNGDFEPVSDPGAQNVLAEEDGVLEIPIDIEGDADRVFFKVRKD